MRFRSPWNALDALEFLAAGGLLAALKDVAPTANGADSATRTRTAPPSPVGEVNEVAEEEDDVEDETTQRCPHCEQTLEPLDYSCSEASSACARRRVGVWVAGFCEVAGWFPLAFGWSLVLLARSSASAREDS